MPESRIVRTKRDGQIATLDNGGAHTYVTAWDPGDFTWDVPAEAVNAFLDRGILSGTTGIVFAPPNLRYGDEQPMTLGFTAHLRDLGDLDNTYATLPDIVFRYPGRHVDTSWISTLSGFSDVFTVTVQLTIDGSAFGEADKTLVFPYTVLRGSGTEGDPDTINVTGTSYTARPLLV